MTIGDFLAIDATLAELDDDVCELPELPQEARDQKNAIFRDIAELRRRLRALTI